VELLDLRHHRVGVIRFAGAAELTAPLAADVVAAVRALEGETAGGGTDLAEALSLARTHLRQAGRPEALPVVVLLTDGRHNAAGDPRAEAEAARSAGVSLYTIGLGGDVDGPGLQALAGGAERYYFAPSPGDLYPIYSEILRTVITSLAGALIVDVPSAAAAPPVPGSSRPPALVGDDGLRWGRSLLPADGVTWTWRVRPLQPGMVDVHDGASATYSDADGARRLLALPTAQLRVLIPTPTATPLPPPPAFLPAVLRDACPKGARTLAVALLIDTSGSMAGDKLERAQEAARGFLDLLELPEDRAAVIGFDAEARLLADLTGDRRSLDAALSALAPGEGTRFDRALRLAATTLAGPSRPSRSRAAIILLSDGGAEEDRSALIALAAEIRGAEVALYTIALGAEADRPLLAALADPDGAWTAAEPAALGALFRRLAAELPCR
jgi:Mg-chelatase subunit ChlD